MSRIYVSNTVEKVPTQVRISGAYTMNYSTLRAVSEVSIPYKTQDFRDTPNVDIPARRPEMVRVTGPIDQDAPQDHDRGPPVL